MYGHRNPFELHLSTCLMYAPVNKGRAAADTLSSGNKNQMMICGIVGRSCILTTATGVSCSMSTAASKTPTSDCPTANTTILPRVGMKLPP